ncbi:ferritin [Candidatus Woesearchaeota archaeon]|nr:ferritin [Candidatus Woesearchaeota archaeon]
MAVRTWRCNICGDGYVGEGRPTHCPFCGAPDKYIVEAEKYKEPVVGRISEVSAKNVMEAMKLEVGNSQFYFCAANKSRDIGLQARFKALGKVEAEHASLLSKMVGAQPPVIDRNAGQCKADDKALLQESHDREARSIEHYRKFLQEASEMRVKQVFAALVEIETTHIGLEDGGA